MTDAASRHAEEGAALLEKYKSEPRRNAPLDSAMDRRQQTAELERGAGSPAQAPRIAAELRRGVSTSLLDDPRARISKLGI